MWVPGTYIPGLPPSRIEPLARFLPPLPDGVVSSWLQELLPITPGGSHPWVLDAFGASPRLALEAARAGYRVLVTASNPINRFLLELAANPPSKNELRSALAELAAARKGDERLELHIRSLYATICDKCGKSVIAEAFLWDREANQPFARIYHCEVCGESGEHPVIDHDLIKLAQFSGTGLHHARALERVVRHDDPDRRHVEEALAVYLPRALYALFNILNRVDGLSLQEGVRNRIYALCLVAFDLANTLWHYPTSRARPRQLTTPTRFRENNVWLALEQAIDLWSQETASIPLRRWPDLPPPTGGMVIFEGRLKDLVESRPDLDIQAVIAPLPRPNQAYWTLSALWAGWLWGRQALGPFKSVLRRRRYDWAWHTTALHTALVNLASLIKLETPVLGLIGENEAGFQSAALLAAEAAGFELLGVAERIEIGQVQFIWRRRAAPAPKPLPAGEDLTRAFAFYAQKHLKERGEPTSFQTLQLAALVGVIQNHGFESSSTPADLLAQINTAFENALSYRRGFARFGGSEKSLEVGLWWLLKAEETSSPLADRVEESIVALLQEHPGVMLLELDRMICNQFPGMLTPGSELIQVSLESYGEQDPPASGRWRLRPQELPENRLADAAKIASLLVQLSGQMGCTATGANPVVYYDAHGAPRYVFHLITSAVISGLIFASSYPAEISWIVLPGSRANLVAYKIQHDPRLRLATEMGWRFLKFRHVRRLAETRWATPDILEQQLAQDSLTYDAPQLRLF